VAKKIDEKPKIISQPGATFIKRNCIGAAAEER
jgi:hypothetical protein